MGFSFAHLLVLLAVIVLLFGTGKLRSLGSDLGAAIKGFKKAISDEDAEKNKEVKTLPDKDKPE
jgi:TatA/E family protein of Tat protein translocase